MASASTVRILEHHALVYRRTFRSSLVSSFVNPVLFLGAMGVGLGTYVGQAAQASLGGMTYLQFLAPGLLAATVMQSAAFEATFPIMAGLVWFKTFHAMYATPIEPADIAFASFAWTAIRLTMIATIFTLVVVAFGAAASPLIVLAIPAAVLTGLAFATPIAAFSATQSTPEKFNYIFRFGVTPLFLFSGTFFPIESLPGALQPIAWLSPLWHGADLARGLAAGTVVDRPLVALAHVAVLSAITILGAWAATRTLRNRLVRG